MPIEIVKVQVSLVGEIQNECIVYDRARKHVVKQPLLNDVRTALKGDYKGYFKAVWFSVVVGWGISERVPDQDW